MRPKQKLKIALPKKGRLRQAFENVANKNGITFTTQCARSDFGTLEKADLPPGYFSKWLEVIYEQPVDMYSSFKTYGLNACLMGRDNFNEEYSRLDLQRQAQPLKIAQQFKRCDPSRMVIASKLPIRFASDLEGKTVATSYPNSLKRWLRDEGVNYNSVNVLQKSGGVEDTVRRGVADAVCDIAQTGHTLSAYGLTERIRVIDKIFPVLLEPVKPLSPENSEFLSIVKATFSCLMQNNIGYKPAALERAMS